MRVKYFLLFVLLISLALAQENPYLVPRETGNFDSYLNGEIEERNVVLLDVKLELLTDSVLPGSEIKFKALINNKGFTNGTSNIDINYTLRNLDTLEVITSFPETILADGNSTFTKAIPIPPDLPLGTYEVSISAEYPIFSKDAYASGSFFVKEDAAVRGFFRRLFLSFIPWIIIMMLPLGVILPKYYKRWKEAKAKKARYIQATANLPGDQDDSVKIGKLPGTDTWAFWNLNDLTTHLIVAGATGSGKSVSAQVITEEVLLTKRSVVVFDPTAQWTGFLARCRHKGMLAAYPKFEMKEEDARAFKGMILEITDPKQKIDLREFMNPGEITVFTLNKLTTEQFDDAVRNIIAVIFSQTWEESAELRMLVIFDEVHRLLTKYGGKGGYVALEKACREFRKWGIGLMMISQVLSDFKEAVKGNILSEIQMHSKGGADIQRVQKKYGKEFADRITKQEIGVGLLQNPRYNKGKPWFVHFRPLLHSAHKLVEKDIKTYQKLGAELVGIKKKIKELKKQKIDTGDIELEAKLAEDKLKVGSFRMVETYLEGLKSMMKDFKKK